MKKKLIAIVGPTATGKSDLAILIAKELNGEIISADSAQVYRGLDIGSAKITKEEQQDIPHHLIDIVGPETDYNIGMFQHDAQKAIEDVSARGNVPILCGGSGLYINSVINVGYNLDRTPSADPVRRQQWLKLEEERGEGTLYRLLCKKFPYRGEKIHPHDYQRILRALEMEEDIVPEKEPQWESPYDLRIYGLTMRREYLYERIEKRVDRMLESGLAEEVSQLLKDGYRLEGNAMAALGYKEMLPFLNKECTLEAAGETLKRNTRHFAKRQLTWFKRDPRIQWFDIIEDGGISMIAKQIISLEKNNVV